MTTEEQGEKGSGGIGINIKDWKKEQTGKKDMIFCNILVETIISIGVEICKYEEREDGIYEKFLRQTLGVEGWT